MTGTEERPAGESAVRIAANVQVTRHGYRAVLLASAISKLRFVLPVMAFFAFGALAAGFTAHSFLLLVGLVGVVAFVWFYVNWASGSPAHQDVYMPVEYVFAPDGIEYAGDPEAGTIAWDRMRRWRVLAHHYLLYTDTASFLLVPADAVEPQLRAAFEQLLDEKVRAKRRL